MLTQHLWCYAIFWVLEILLKKTQKTDFLEACILKGETWEQRSRQWCQLGGTKCHGENQPGKEEECSLCGVSVFTRRVWKADGQETFETRPESEQGSIILTRVNSLRRKESKRHELHRDRRELRQVSLRLDGQLTAAIAVFTLRR